MNPLIRYARLLAWFLLLVGVSRVWAVGAKENPEEGLPLSIDSAYPIEFLGREFQFLTRYERSDEGEDGLWLEARLEFGVWWNTELKLSVPYLIGEQQPNDLQPINLELTYNINQETLRLPAFSLAGGVELPTGSAGDGYDPYVKLLMTKTLGKSWLFHQVHLNVEYQWNDDVQADQREGRYMLAAGYSRRLSPDMLLVFDLVREQEWHENEEINLAELGLRYQLTPQAVISSGVGFGFGDESPEVRLTMGLQYEF